jgi:hypothetical protein
MTDSRGAPPSTRESAPPTRPVRTNSIELRRYCEARGWITIEELAAAFVSMGESIDSGSPLDG